MLVAASGVALAAAITLGALHASRSTREHEPHATVLHDVSVAVAELESGTEYERGMAAFRLGEMGIDTACVWNALVDALDDEYGPNRSEALCSIWKLRPHARETAVHIRRMLFDDAWVVRSWAVRLAAKLPTDERPERETILRMLGDTESAVAARAAYCAWAAYGEEDAAVSTIERLFEQWDRDSPRGEKAQFYAADAMVAVNEVLPHRVRAVLSYMLQSSVLKTQLGALRVLELLNWYDLTSDLMPLIQPLTESEDEDLAWYSTGIVVALEATALAEED
jgi:hypothetical protein